MTDNKCKEKVRKQIKWLKEQRCPSHCFYKIKDNKELCKLIDKAFENL